MQVFKVFMKMINRKKLVLIIYAIVFAILLIAMTGSKDEDAVGGFIGSNFKYTVFNEDEGIIGDKLIEYLNINNEYVKADNNKDLLLDEMFYRNLDCAVYIPKDFTQKLIEGESKELLEIVLIPGIQSGELAKNTINQYMSTFQVYLQCGYEIEEADELTRKDLSKEITVKMLNGTEQEIDNNQWGVYFIFLPYILLCVLIMGIGPVLISFAEKSLEMRNKCSATSLFKMNIGKMGGCIVFVLICYALFMTIAMILYSKYLFTRNGVLIMIAAGIFALIAAAIAFIAAQYAKDDNVLNMIANTLGLAMSFLGGVFVPASWFSEDVLRISKLMPTYWYIKAIDEITLLKDGVEIPETIFQYFGILVLFTIALFAIGLLLSKIKTQRN